MLTLVTTAPRALFQELRDLTITGLTVTTMSYAARLGKDRPVLRVAEVGIRNHDPHTRPSSS